MQRAVEPMPGAGPVSLAFGDGAEQLRILYPSNCTADAVRAAALCWKEPSYHSCTRNLLSGFLAVEEGGWKASPIMGLPREVLAIFPDGSLPYSKRNRGWKVPVGTFPSCSAQAPAFPRASPGALGVHVVETGGPLCVL